MLAQRFAAPARPVAGVEGVTLQVRPPGIRPETAAVARLERGEPLDNGGRSAFARVVERAATKRRKAGAEDHATVEKIGVLDHFLPEAGHGIVQHRKDQPILEIRGWCAGAPWLDRLAVAPPADLEDRLILP